MKSPIITPEKAINAKVRYMGSLNTYDFVIHQYDDDGVYDVFGVFKFWRDVVEIEQDC